MGGQIYTIYCNQIYQVEEKTGLLRRNQLQRFHRPVNSFPFVLNDGSPNSRLLEEISCASQVFFGNPVYPSLHGELWTVIKDKANGCFWGLFICSYYPYDESQGVLLNYALCPLNNIASVSREELLSALMRANLIQEWGRVHIEGRFSRSIVGNHRTEALIQELVNSRQVQLVYGQTGRVEAASWMDQIFLKIQTSGKAVSSFYAYQDYHLEHFLSNQFTLPKLLLFSGDPFQTLNQIKWKCHLPLRGAPHQCARVVSISSPFHDSSKYGAILFAPELQPRMLALKDVPKNSGNSIQLKQNILKNLIVQEEHEDSGDQVKDGQQYCLYHIRTKQGYPIVTTPFWIGRAAQLDCTVDNDRVSRKHACITSRNNEYYLTDHSRNGTIVNGVRLASGQAYRLESGAQILIDNEAFCFQVY